MCRYARNIKPRSAKRLVAVMPRRGLSAGDGVEGLPRGGKQRAQIFTFLSKRFSSFHLFEVEIRD
jgi:hypothetical protein